MLAVGSLADHMTKQHDIYQSFVLEEEQDARRRYVPGDGKPSTT